MEFPVDILATVDPESLEQSAKDYMSKLLYRNSEKHDYLSISGSKKIEIGLCNVSFVPLYGVDIKQKVLALFSPEEPFKAVGLYLLDQWWSAEDILKTADSSRTGLVKVKTPGERIVLYVLNRIIYRMKEMARDDVPFLCHGEDEIAKILWKNGEAVGFYSVKPEGRLCNSFLTKCYQLPVMDTIFIRQCHRGNGHGLQMLEDFVKSFKKDLIGLKYPLSPAMYKVCKKYLSLHPEDKELLWEIEGVGSPFQRTQIDKKLKAMDVKGNHQVVGKLNFDTEDSDIQMEVGITQERETMTEYTEVVEEVVQIKITKEMQDMGVLTHGRISNLKHKKHLADIEETTEKIIRVEGIQPVVQCVDDDLMREDGTLSSNSKEDELKDTVETVMHDVTPKSEITHLHCEEQNNLTPKPTHQSEMEKEQVVEITPVMAIQNLKGNEDTQIMKTFEATIVPVCLKPLELQQVVKVEIVKMSSETETVEVKEIIDDVNKEIPLDRREPFEEIKESKRGQTEMEETANKDDVEDKVGMGKPSVVENIIDDREVVDVEKKEAGALEVSLLEKQQSEQVKKRDTVDKTDMVRECLCEIEQESNDAEDVNAAEDFEVKVPEPFAAEHTEEQEAEPASEMVPAEIVQSTKEATSTLKMQKVVVHVDLDKVSITHTDVREDAKGTSQPESTNHREGKEADRLTQKVELTEKEQEVEMTENENVTVKVMDKIQYNNIEEIEEMMETESVITTDAESVSELTIDENKMGEFQGEKTLKETKTVKDTPGDKITSKDIIGSSEDDEGVKSDAQTVLYEEDRTLLRRSRRLKHQAAESELMKNVITSSTKTVKATSKPKVIKQQVKSKPPVDDPEVEQMKEVLESHTGTAVEEKIESVSITTKDCSEYIISAFNDVEEEINIDEEHLEDKVPDYQTIREVENKTEDSSQEENKVGTMLRNEEQEKAVVDKTSEVEKIAVIYVHDTEDVRVAEREVEGKSAEPDFAETVEEQQEEPASETVPTEDDNTEEATSTPKLQNVAVVLVDFNKVPAKLESDDREMDRKTSQPQEEVVQELHKPQNIYHRNEGKDGVNQTGGEVELSEKEQEVEMIENEQEETEEVRDEKMEINENIMSKLEDESPKSAFTDEKETDEAQEEEPMKQTNNSQDEEPIIQDDIESSEHDELNITELSEEEEEKTSFETPLRQSRRLKHQATESKLTKRALRSATKATKTSSKTKTVKQHVEMKQPVDDPEVEQMQEVRESHTETAVDEKIESESIATESEHVKAVEGETSGRSAAEPVKQQEEEPASETGPAEDDDAVEATSEVEGKVQEEGAATEMVHGEDRENIMESTSVLMLQAASVVLVDVRVLPSLTGDCSYALQAAHVETSNRLEMSEQVLDMPEEVMEELQIEDVEGDNIETESVNPTEGDPVDLNTGAKDTAQEDSNVVMSNLGDVTTDTRTFEEKKYIDEIKVDEVSGTEQFTLQDPILIQKSVLNECSEMTTRVQDILDLHNTEIVKDNISFEEKEEELTTELALEEGRENVDKSMSMLKLHKATVVLVDFQRQMGRNETDENETTQEVAFLTKADEEKALVEMDRTEPVTERKIEEDAVELSTDNTLITNDEQDRDILAEGMKDDLKEVKDIILKESTSTELDANKIYAQDEDISVYTSRNLRHRTLPVKATPEGKSGHLQKVYKESNVNEHTEEEISDEVETVFIRHLRRRTITVTPRKRSKHLTGTRARDGEPEMEAYVTKVCYETVAVQSTEEARTAVEEMHENNSKCDSEEVPAVSEAARKDQQQDKNIPENDAEKVEEVNDGGKDMVEEAFETTAREIVVESDLPENQEKEEPEEPRRKEVRSAKSEQERDQQNNTLEEMVLEKEFEENLNKRVEEKDSTMKILITEAILVQSEEGVGVEKRALRKRSISVKAASVRKSKRLRKQAQVENDGETDVLANTEESALSGPVVMEMANVKSPTKNKTTDHGKGQELEDTNTIGREISYKEENQDNAGGEEMYGEANNRQESTVTEVMSKQARFSEFLNVSGEGTDNKLVVQEEENGEENREEQPVTEEVMESEYNAGKGDKVTDEPKEFEDTREKSEQSETNAEGITEASVSVDENFTLELDEEINSNDAECNQLVKETKASFQESEKEITDTEQEPGVMTEHIHQGRRSARRGRGVLQDSQSEMEDNSETEEVKEVIGEEEKKPQDKKRKGIIAPSFRRSKRLAREEIM